MISPKILGSKLIQSIGFDIFSYQDSFLDPLHFVDGHTRSTIKYIWRRGTKSRLGIKYSVIIL